MRVPEPSDMVSNVCGSEHRQSASPFGIESFYRASREYIAGLLEALLETPGVTTLEPRVVSRCMEIYRSHDIEIVDAYLVALAEETKTPVLATFDKKDFRRFPHLKLIP